ncbi:ABC transporter ATP-binding protein [Helicobacter sp. 11S02629-2]|uniref:ATP-binding cassette domain-containing protein n=1 Tax=Helicobacter sp. 11S02629-2 TaxID=1476195 RepID=UPI000BA5FE61|nr:ABC transporter ATP-binding protein [Helicobacter sp. 11S02629-2]PAF45960.1 hypothetical protein BKH40_00685 [Helicobacter sp. 11S02629-2]
MSDTLLLVKNLSKTKNNIEILKDINFSIDKGQVVGLLGANGSGKTSLLKLIALLNRPSEGSIEFDSKPLSIESKNEMVFLPDLDVLDAKSKISSIISFYEGVFYNFKKDIALEILDSLKIKSNAYINRCSKGTREKIALALTMARQVKLYMFDEPIVGIDPVARDLVLGIILKYKKQDSSLIISTHLLNEVEAILDTALFMYEGRLIANKKLNDIKESGLSLEASFKELILTQG